MLLSSIKEAFNRKEINCSIVQFMVMSGHFENRPYAYCSNVKHLLDDWHGECNYCPKNDAMLLMATLYRHGNAYPIAQIGLNEDITFEDLMMALDE
jgi:hypothetical protein